MCEEKSSRGQQTMLTNKVMLWTQGHRKPPKFKTVHHDIWLSMYNGVQGSLEAGRSLDWRYRKYFTHSTRWGNDKMNMHALDIISLNGLVRYLITVCEYCSGNILNILFQI